MLIEVPSPPITARPVQAFFIHPIKLGQLSRKVGTVIP